MKSMRYWVLSLAATLGCGEGESKKMIKSELGAGGGGAVDGANANVDGKPGVGGENPLGPKRSESDKKIEEIKANKDIPDDLKKQLIDEVERTYKEAQGGFKKS
ncbi:MAG TPA: hypothetical protein VNC50_18265 [Planctomycetia bacterium]|jgi:hypothetical protein|nr:hypothetical protein [Planctomycetia bacterium]